MNSINPNWERLQQLDYFFGYGRVEIAIKILQDPDSEDFVKESVLDELFDGIFHQITTISGTYVVAPLLVDLVDIQPAEVQYFLLRMIGLMGLQAGTYPKSLTRAEVERYEKSLPVAGEKAIGLFRNLEPKNTRRHQDLFVAIASLSGFRDEGWRLWRGEEEDKRDCPHCGASWMSVGLAIPYSSELDSTMYFFDSEARYAYPIDRKVEKEAVTPRSDWPEGSAATSLYRLAMESGNDRVAAWIANFYGSAKCPECSEVVELI